MARKTVAMEAVSAPPLTASFSPETVRNRPMKRNNSPRLTAPLRRKISGPILWSTTGKMKIVKQYSERKKKLI